MLDINILSVAFFLYIISYLRVYPWELKLYHPEPLLYSLKTEDIMQNYFKMIVFKQLTISIKTQNDNKIKVSCSANKQNVTLHGKHDHQ